MEPGEINPFNLDVVVYSFITPNHQIKVLLININVVHRIYNIYTDTPTNREIIVACHIHIYIYTYNALIENECISEKSN